MFAHADRIRMDSQIEPFILPVSTLSTVGIIVTEVITNTIKHGFEPGEGGRITVSAGAKGGSATIAVQDDGKGIPESVDIESSDSFGLTLIRALVEQLDGTLQIGRAQGGGARFVIEFPLDGNY